MLELEEEVEEEEEWQAYFPLVWLRIPQGCYRIENICRDRIDEAIGLILNGFVKEESVCCFYGVHQDSRALMLFGDMCHNWLEAGTSMCTIDEETGEMVGVLIARVVNSLKPSRSFLELRPDLQPTCPIFQNVLQWRQIVHNKIQRYYLDLKSEYFEIYGFYVERKHRNRGVGSKLVQAAKEMALVNQCNLLVGVFTTPMSITVAMGIFETIILSYPLPTENKFGKRLNALVKVTEIQKQKDF